MKQRGFTIIELLVAIVILIAIGAVFVVQKVNLDAAARDDTRRTAINAMHFSLEDVYFKENNFYPQSIDSKTLTAMDGELFTDPDGDTFGSSKSDYRYEPKNCNLSGECKAYTLRATLENEADYVKENR